MSATITANDMQARRRRLLPRFRFNMRSLLPPAIMAVVVLLGWQGAVAVFDIEKYILPTPLDIADVYRHDFSTLWFNVEFTLYEAVVGYVIGALVGWVFGVAFAGSVLLERAFLPYVVASNTIPVVAVTPILIIVLGQGAASKIAVTAFLCFFPVCINTLKGLRATPTGAIELMRVQAASRRQEFIKVRLPASLPYVFVGLKLGATFSVIGAIVAEFVGSTRGLGYLMVQSSYVLDTPTLWASMLASAVLGILLFLVVVAAERRLVGWHEATTL